MAAPTALGARGAELFRAQAALYASHRPSYPAELFDAVLSFAGLEQGGRQLALDVATGTGQVATALADRFDAVLACDASQQQLDHADQRPNITYFLSPAERLDRVDDGSVDLLTVAQALHWFDLPAFLKEARRVLRPGGTLAVWGYGLPLIASPPGRPPHAPATLAALHRAMHELHTCTLGALWDPGRELLWNCYQGLEPGREHFGTVERRDLRMTKDVNVAGALGFLSSWSAYNTYKRQHPDGPDPLDTFRGLLLEAAGPEEAAGADSLEPVLRLDWHVFMILARDPVAPQAGA
ncbi:hypothetical protein ABPG77_000256 [Micractinium sp. CCAP 211/92]